MNRNAVLVKAATAGLLSSLVQLCCSCPNMNLVHRIQHAEEHAHDAGFSSHAEPTGSARRRCSGDKAGRAAACGGDEIPAPPLESVRCGGEQGQGRKFVQRPGASQDRGPLPRQERRLALLASVPTAASGGASAPIHVCRDACLTGGAGAQHSAVLSSSGSERGGRA